MNQKYLAVCGMLVPFVYILLYISGGALRPGYSHLADSVSELLSPGAPNKALLDGINYLFGLLITFFGIGVFQFASRHPDSTLVGKIGAAMVIALGLASIGSAIFPQDATGTSRTLAGTLHIIFVFGFQIPGSLLSTLLIGIWLRQSGALPGFALHSLITTGAILLAGIAAGPTMSTPIMGLVERISALVVHQWIFFLGWHLFRQ